MTPLKFSDPTVGNKNFQFSASKKVEEERDLSSQTLLKPKGTAEASRKSSTCQPGRVSIKYSEMLLVKAAAPSFTVVATVEGEVLAIKVGCEVADEAETEFFTKFCDLEMDMESEPLVKRELEVEGE